MTTEYPHMQKPLDTITHISADQAHSTGPCDMCRDWVIWTGFLWAAEQARIGSLFGFLSTPVSQAALANPGPAREKTEESCVDLEPPKKRGAFLGFRHEWIKTGVSLGLPASSEKIGADVAPLPERNMMENQQSTIDEAVEAVLCGCVNCISVPLSVLQLEVDMPIGGWDGMLERLDIKLVTDHIGRKAVTAAAARQLLKTVRRRDELAVEDAQRRTESLAKKYPIPEGRGLPAQEGMTPFESMVAAGGVVSPQDEFGGRPKPRFLQEQLAEGQREMDEKKREAAARAKQRLADQMKDRLR